MNELNNRMINIGKLQGKVLVFGGVYSNLQALEALQKVAKKEGIAPSNIICTGDIIAYCAQPSACVDAVQDWGIHAIQGNVEENIILGKDDCGCNFTEGGRCDIFSRMWFPYAVSKMTERNINYLNTLPQKLDFTYADRAFRVLHGSEDHISDFVFKSTDWSVKASHFVQNGADVILAGHCGIPFVDERDDKTWLNAGVIGMPANDSTKNVWYVLMDDKDGVWTYSFHRLQYDFKQAHDLMVANDLPETYARTLVTGIWDSNEILPEQEAYQQGTPLELDLMAPKKVAIEKRKKSLSVTGSPLNDTFFQLKVLNGKEIADTKFTPFGEKIAPLGFKPLKATGVDIFQINIGKLCNQVCTHCHVDAGPDKKKENMDRETLEICLDIIRNYPVKTVDITGGAPEMNPHFRWFVEECRKAGKTVIDRCNLTIIEANKKYYDLPMWFAEHQVHIISSLPYFSKDRTDSQRGDGVFEDSISALRKLNDVGYGQEGSGLILDLVYNPSGAFLPGNQYSLENEFKKHLKQNYDIVFNNLFAITNMPIARFLDYLLESGDYEEYMSTLVNAFNPSTVEHLMCRNTISVSWDGYMYDCDFNQMLDLPIHADSKKHIRDFDYDTLLNRNIVLNQHCYGCTAGAGSSCVGEV
jgi:radical SAM/Cys-rich protein